MKFEFKRIRRKRDGKMFGIVNLDGVDFLLSINSNVLVKQIKDVRLFNERFEYVL